jgi:hypothetical protein
MSPFDQYLAQIERALDAELYYPALALSLTLPDICVSCELAHTQPTTQTTYKQWCVDYFGTTLEPYELYTLRCAFLHNGTSQFAKRHRARGRTKGVTLQWHGSRPTGMIQIELKIPRQRMHQRMHDAALLCRMLVKGARKWKATRGTAKSVAQRRRKLIGVATLQE